jgi:hypothetical protein
MARPPFLLRKFSGTFVQIVPMKGPPGLSEMIQNCPNFGFEGIKWFHVAFGPSSLYNSGFGWRNIPRIGLFAWPNSMGFRYSSPRLLALPRRTESVDGTGWETNADARSPSSSCQ